MGEAATTHRLCETQRGQRVATPGMLWLVHIPFLIQIR